MNSATDCSTNSFKEIDGDGNPVTLLGPRLTKLQRHQSGEAGSEKQERGWFGDRRFRKHRGDRNGAGEIGTGHIVKLQLATGAAGDHGRLLRARRVRIL